MRNAPFHMLSVVAPMHQVRLLDHQNGDDDEQHEAERLPEPGCVRHGSSRRGERDLQRAKESGNKPAGGGVWMYQEERNQLLCSGLVRVPQHDTAKAHLHRA